MSFARETTRVAYEWDVERMDEHGDIIDHDFCDAFPYQQEQDEYNATCLVKTYAKGIAGDDLSFDIVDRAWAYMVDGKLPVEFDDGTKVPKRFHQEVERKTGGAS